MLVDRPGMGASTDVPLVRRIDVWVDTVPRLLAHLCISSVTLASHSAGTIYLLNTWVRCRGLVNQHIVLLGAHSGLDI
jgi:pimeloyl-ACP methyl ester carboxylesterase